MPLQTEEVWVRGNVRPVLAVGAIAVGGAALAAGAAAASGASPAVVWSLGAAAGVAALLALVLARAAAGLRVGRRGDALLLRLSPARVEAIPLSVVECVFPGSQPLGGAAQEHAEDDAATVEPPTRRVGTLVIRFAERATEWRERPTFAPWGTWRDGHAIVDGRWCEPLSAALARRIGDRLLEAKRQAASGEPAR